MVYLKSLSCVLNIPSRFLLIWFVGSSKRRKSYFLTIIPDRRIFDQKMPFPSLLLSFHISFLPVNNRWKIWQFPFLFAKLKLKIVWFDHRVSKASLSSHSLGTTWTGKLIWDSTYTLCSNNNNITFYEAICALHK